MNFDQENKYDIEANLDGISGYLVNRASGERIPDDEPVIIFRARDVHVIPMLQVYTSSCRDPEHRVAIATRMQDFAAFRSRFPERMKEPDTVIIERPKQQFHLDPDEDGDG
jgi:hypothetical protein